MVRHKQGGAMREVSFFWCPFSVRSPSREPRRNGSIDASSHRGKERRTTGRRTLGDQCALHSFQTARDQARKRWEADASTQRTQQPTLWILEFLLTRVMPTRRATTRITQIIPSFFVFSFPSPCCAKHVSVIRTKFSTQSTPSPRAVTAGLLGVRPVCSRRPNPCPCRISTS